MRTGERYEFITDVISNGRVTIPAKIRKFLNISEGDEVRLIIVPLRRHENTAKKSKMIINSTILGNWIELIEIMREELDNEIPAPTQAIEHAKEKLREASEALAILQVNLSAVEEVVQENESG